MLARVEHLMRNTSLENFLQPLCIPIFESENIQDLRQVGRILRADVCNAKWLNEFAKRIWGDFFKWFVKRLQFRDETPIFFAFVGIHPHAANESNLQQTPNRFSLEAIREKVRGFNGCRSYQQRTSAYMFAHDLCCNRT